MQRGQRSSEVRSQEMPRPSVFLFKIRLAESESFIGFLQKAFQDFPNFLKKYLCWAIFLPQWKCEQEKSERRYHVVKGWEGVRWDIFTISSGCLLLLSSLFNPFFHLFSLLDLCFSISPYANKPSILLRGRITGRGEDGEKNIKETQRRETERWTQDKRGREEKNKFGVGADFEFVQQPASRDPTGEVSTHPEHPRSDALTPSKTFLSVLCHLWRRCETFPWAK